MKMEKLTTLTSNNDFRKLLIRVGDLVNFDGPMLTLYENAKTSHFFLLDWVDRSNSNNRWIIYRVNPIDLMKFLSKQISHLDLFSNRPEINVYVVDIPINGRLLTSEIKELYTIPEIYHPNAESYFDKEDSVLLERIEGKINNSLSQIKSRNEVSGLSLKNFTVKYGDQSFLNSTNHIEKKSRKFKWVVGTNQYNEYNLDIVSNCNVLKRQLADLNVFNESFNSGNLNTYKKKYA